MNKHLFVFLPQLINSICPFYFNPHRSTHRGTYCTTTLIYFRYKAESTGSDEPSSDTWEFFQSMLFLKIVIEPISSNNELVSNEDMSINKEIVLSERVLSNYLANQEVIIREKLNQFKVMPFVEIRNLNLQRKKKLNQTIQMDHF